MISAKLHCFTTLLVVVICIAPNLVAQSGTEDFESFSIGDLDGQSGWSSEAGAQIENTGIAGFGDRSIRAANGIAPIDGNYVTSPVLGNGYGVLSLDIQIDDPDSHARYILSPQVGGGRTASLSFFSDGSLGLDRSIGTCSINSMLIGGSWNRHEVLHLDWQFFPDADGSVVTDQKITLNDEVIFQGGNHLGCGFNDEIDSFRLWSFGSNSVDVTIDNVSFTPVLPSGDINDDGVLDVTDINFLIYGIAQGIHSFDYDMNGDTKVDLLDRDLWLAVAGAANLPAGNPYLLGDVNLDGSVDGTDYLAWNSNKFTNTGGWLAADFNADGTTDGADFLLWNQFKFATSDVAAVPEPSCGFGLALLAIGLLRRKGQ